MIITLSEPAKRGDILQTNIGDKRERTWLILKARGHKVWAERWWDMEPALRMALYRSAERAGGQRVHLEVRRATPKHRRPRIWQ